MNIYWYALDKRAKIPTKRDEDAGFDIYTIEDNVLIMPFEKRLFSTGIAVAPEKGYWCLVYDRGSTGSRGMHVHCGVVDNGYRGEIFVCLCNDNPYPIKITSAVEKPYHAMNDYYTDTNGQQCCGEIDYYPVSKAIAQIIVVPQINTVSHAVDSMQWEQFCNTERGAAKLGASGK